MTNRFSRTELLVGKEALKKLKHANVAIFGIGGVGGYVAESLARSGVGHFFLVDSDRVDVTNINRQIIALESTVGQYKIEAMKARILDINPQAKVTTQCSFFLPENSNVYDFTKFDYIIDAVDTVTAKLEIIRKAYEDNVPVISCMGAGNKLSPTGFTVTDIENTSVCPLAKVMRKELKTMGIEHVKVVYSKEKPIKTESDFPGSNSFVPAVAGLVMASYVATDLTK